MFSAIGRAVRGIYDQPSLEAPLLNSLILKRGVGNPSFTRADTASYSVTVTDFEGLIRPVKNGEARFEGARRVENLIPQSQTITSWWAKHAEITLTGGQSDPFGGNNAFKVTGTASTKGIYQTSVFSAGLFLVASVWLRADVSTGVGIGRANAGGQVVWPTSTWRRYSVTMTTTNNDGPFIYSPDNSFTFYIYGIQYERPIGQANQNPSEYVSNGVLSAPYHGAGVDAVKWFSTVNANVVV
jgi:hypothetical protein